MSEVTTKKKRVVVTGIGAVTPLGLTMSETWQALVSSKSGVDHISLFDTTNFKTKIAAEVKDFQITDYISRKECRHMDRFTKFAVAATLQAIEQAKLNIKSENNEDTGVIFGNCVAGLAILSEQHKLLLDRGPDRVSPFLAPTMTCDAPSIQISLLLGVKGVNFSVSSMCSSSSDAIGQAFEIISHGSAKVIIAGGTEAPIVPLCVAAFESLRALSQRNHEPQKAYRPFDLERDGLVLGEGAVVLVLEELNRALERGAPILAEIIGYAATSDAHHLTQPVANGEGAARALRLVLDKAELTPTDIDYINAHGTATLLNDRSETQAIKSVFGEQAYHIPMSATKSMTGHLFGAAGALEAAICILALVHQVVPPTINLSHPDPECDLDYVPIIARRTKVRTVLSNSFGFGGHNSILAFRSYPKAA